MIALDVVFSAMFVALDALSTQRNDVILYLPGLALLQTGPKTSTNSSHEIFFNQIDLNLTLNNNGE